MTIMASSIVELLHFKLTNAVASSKKISYAVSILVVGLLYRLLRSGSRSAAMPPGPPTVPILGNAHQVPVTRIHEKFTDWSRLYGKIFSLKFGSGNTIVICDRKAVHDLLDKKGNIYSDRPGSYVSEVLGVKENVFVSSMDNMWKEKRKVISHNLSPAQLDKNHFRVQEAEATVLMNDFLTSPKDYRQHIRRYTASIIHIIIHGFRATSLDSFWGRAVYEVVERRSECMEPGANPPVDQFPILKYIPEKFAFWKARALDSCEWTEKVWGEARDRVESRRKKGDIRDSLADTLLNNYEKNGFPMSQKAFNKLLGEMIEGGADTSSAAMATLLLALAKYPHIQKRAQEEIDKVCGPNKSPVWTDFESLPFINALVKEGLRWRPVAPTSLPHRVREDDTYNGMLIPKDSSIFIGVWQIHNDETVWKDPATFNPDRYLGYDKLASWYAGNSDWAGRDKSPYLC